MRGGNQIKEGEKRADGAIDFKPKAEWCCEWRPLGDSQEVTPGKIINTALRYMGSSHMPSAEWAMLSN